MCKTAEDGRVPVHSATAQGGRMAEAEDRWHALAALVALFLLLQFRAAALQVLPLATLALPFVVLFLRRRQSSKSAKSSQKLRTVSDASNHSYGEHEDYVRWSFLPSSGVLRTNTSKAIQAQENDLAKFRFLVMHRPTHDKELDKSGAWRYGWHFKGRKRLWEVRVQVQFKRKPNGPIWFGVEMSPGQAKSTGFTAHVKSVILAGIQRAIGKGFYQTAGDDEDVEGELEPGTFVMPMWALDQFAISEAGDEPALSGDLGQVGRKRTEGVKDYIKAMADLEDSIRPDKVYTFCFWGISQFIDVNLWEFKGLIPGVKMNASNLSGPPPIYVVAYDLQKNEDGDARHLISKKDYFFKVALWSHLRPPEPNYLRTVLGGHEEDTVAEVHSPKTNGSVDHLRRVMEALPIRDCVTCGAPAPGVPRNRSHTSKELGWLTMAGRKVLGGCMGPQ